MYIIIYRFFIIRSRACQIVFGHLFKKWAWMPPGEPCEILNAAIGRLGGPTQTMHPAHRQLVIEHWLVEYG